VTTVEVLGGNLEIEWKNHDNQVLLTGPAAIVYEGIITV